MKKIMFGFLGFLVLILLSASSAKAALNCTDMVYECGIFGQGNCGGGALSTHTVSCYVNVGVCTVSGPNPCAPQGKCVYNVSGCDEGASGGSCPNECKRDSGNGCGSGFVYSSGCGNCGVDQYGVPKICCEPVNCEGEPGGGGGPPPQNPRCNPGEVFVANDPEQIQCILGEEACRLRNDGIGGDAGDYVPNLSYGCTEEQIDDGKRACRLGTCVVATPPPTATPVACTVKQPTFTGVVQNSSTSSTGTWSYPGALVAGTTQYIRVGLGLQEVANGCNNNYSPPCAAATTLPLSQTSFTATNLVPNSVYYWRVLNYTSNACYLEDITSAVSSCSVSPTTMSLDIGDSSTITAQVNSSTEITSVTFTTDSSYILLNPATDTTYPYQTQVTALQSTGSEAVGVMGE